MKYMESHKAYKSAAKKLEEKVAYVRSELPGGNCNWVNGLFVYKSLHNLQIVKRWQAEH
jgi:hypothetical protein